MEAPSGLNEIVRVFGNINDYIRTDGTLRPDWEWHALDVCHLPAPLKLGWADKEVTRIRCHRLLSATFKVTFDSIFVAGLWTKLHTFDGCFAYRQQREGQKLSTHSWGISIDLNAATNRMGTIGDIDSGIVQLFEANGFRWGGRFGRPDPMHFQYAKDY